MKYANYTHAPRPQVCQGDMCMAPLCGFSHPDWDAPNVIHDPFEVTCPECLEMLWDIPQWFNQLAVKVRREAKEERDV